CQVPVLDGAGHDTGYKVCDLASQACDPIGDTGCPDASLHCYLTSTQQTLCDCPSRMQMLNQDCALYNDCAPGLVCVTTGGVSRCLSVCDQTVPSCSGRTCSPIGSLYGYCQMN